jgi:hypothetical protein
MRPRIDAFAGARKTGNQDGGEQRRYAAVDLARRSPASSACCDYD